MFQKIQSWLLENRGPRQTVLKNTLWLTIGQGVSRLLRAAIVIYAARTLGVESWGAFSYALGVATFLTVFSDIGLNALLTKEATRSPELRDKYLSTALFIKITLLAIIGVVVVILAPYLSKIDEARHILPILLLVFAFDTLRDLGSALSRALEKMQIEAGIQIFTNAAIVGLGFLFLYFSPTSTALASAYALGSAIGLLSIWITLRKEIKGLFHGFTPSLIRPIIAMAWPFGLLGIMGVINLNTDIIMLGWLRTPAEVGYYAAAQKFIQLLYVLPALLAISLFPAMARNAKTNPLRLYRMVRTSSFAVILGALPIAIIGFFYAPFIITTVFGAAFTPAIAAFKILILSILVVFPSSILGHAIFAYDEQKSFIPFALTSTFLNAALNFFFIPWWGIEGAAFSTIFTQIVTNSLIWWKIEKLHRTIIARSQSAV